MDIRLSWRSSTSSSSIFEEVGEIIERPELVEKELNLDVVVIYKATTLRTIAEHIASKIKVESELFSWCLNLVSCTLLFSISPKTTDIHFFEDDDYRKISNLFELKRGERRIDKSIVKNILGAKETLEVLARKNLIKEDEHYYFVIGHILKNIELGKI